MIAAVVVTHSAPPGALATCIDAIAAAGGIDHLIVVDNGDTPNADGERLAGTSMGGALAVEVARTPNRGYGAAANAGFRRAIELGAPAIALLNDDVTVRPGWVAPLVGELADRAVGAAQPKLLMAGTSPALVNSLGVTIGPDGAGTDIGHGTLDVVVAGASDIDCFTGGAVMFSSAFLLDTGGFDERWFLYYEDVDLATRGRALGWRYRLAPTAVVEHAMGATTATIADRTRYLQERNRVRHAVRHCPMGTIGRALWLSVRRLRHSPRGTHARALAAALLASPFDLGRRIARRNRVRGVTIVRQGDPAARR